MTYTKSKHLSIMTEFAGILTALGGLLTIFGGAIAWLYKRFDRAHEESTRKLERLESKLKRFIAIVGSCEHPDCRVKKQVMDELLND